jgi:diamine N-acetyltransferase
MSVELRPITQENLRAVTKLEVRPEQSDFVAPNAVSIAETYVYPKAEPRAVYSGDELVGFVLFHPLDSDSRGHGIVRLMIDHRFQGQGLGRAAIEEAVAFAVREHNAQRVRLSVVPANEKARGLYSSAGFVETGEIDHGEVVMVREV